MYFLVISSHDLIQKIFNCIRVEETQCQLEGMDLMKPTSSVLAQALKVTASMLTYVLAKLLSSNQ